METRRFPRKILAMVPVVLAFVAVLGVPSAHAYGQANWQTAFSGNFTSPTGGKAGFWGWCMFAGAAADGMSGTDSDCQVTTYFSTSGGGASSGNLIHMSIHGSHWLIALTTMGTPPPGVTPFDFFVTEGSVTLTGPSIVNAISSGPPPPGCTVSGSTGTCTIAAAEAIGIYSPDTGIPAAPGHYSFTQLLEVVGVEIPPGNHVNIQVNQLP